MTDRIHIGPSWVSLAWEEMPIGYQKEHRLSLNREIVKDANGGIITDILVINDA